MTNIRKSVNWQSYNYLLQNASEHDIDTDVNNTFSCVSIARRRAKAQRERLADSHGVKCTNGAS